MGALSKAGRIYAGKIGADPIQYSCQKNLIIGIGEKLEDLQTFDAREFAQALVG